MEFPRLSSFKSKASTYFSDRFLSAGLKMNPNAMKTVENRVYERMMKTLPDRVKAPPRRDMFETETVIPYPYAPEALEMMVNYSPHLTTVIDELNKEVFREDILVLPNFAAKCVDCGQEYSEKPDQCDCGGAVRDPDRAQQKLGEDWLEKANPIDPYNDITLTSIFKICERNVDIIDDAWIGITKDYSVDPEGNILDAVPKEIWRGPAERMRLIRDKKARATGFDHSLGEGFYTCVLHRDKNIQEVPGPCPVCGRPMHAAVAICLDDENQPGIAYIAGEVKHWSKYHPSESYGYSNILVCWIIENTILNMDLTSNVTYREKRPYKGFITFTTTNAESLKAAIEEEDDKVQQNPLYIPKFAIETNGQTGGAQFINITPTFEELNMLAHRDTYIRNISAMWGVQPIFMGDLTQSGGLNSEGLEITVTLRAVKFGHSTWHKEVFPWLHRQLGMTDYHYEFPDPIEEDKVARQQRRMNNLTEIQMILGMGAQIEILDQDELDYRIIGELKQPAPEMGGELGGDQYQDFNDYDGEISNLSMVKSRRGIDEERAFHADLMLKYNDIFKRIRTSAHGSMDKAEQKDLARSVVKYVRGKMEASVSDNYANLILRGYRDAGVDPVRADLDIGSIKAMARNSPVWDSFANLGKSLNKKFGEIITDAFAVPGEFSVENMISRMRKTSDLETYRLTMIARTETNAVVNEGRTRGYKHRDPQGDFKYKLVGLFDPHRTCKAHMWLRSQINNEGGAVTMKRMEELHKTAFARFIKPKNPKMTQRGFTIHINQITKIVRAVE